ncbi:MAG: hypothetical protein K8T20_10405 [Planctomycetes bacterium]|nr:hypothetical protein [Planctomycetota bacterium]
MFKVLLATGVLLTAAASVARVGIGPAGVSVGGAAVTSPVLQLREAEGGNVLASHDVVEPLGGVVEVSFDGGRLLTLEPGVRLSRVASGYELSSHGRRPILVHTSAGALEVTSPAAVSAVDGGWTIGTSRLEGAALHASLSEALDTTRVAEAKNGSTSDASGLRNTFNRQLRIRRLLSFDPVRASEAANENALKAPSDVSPIGF